MDYYEDEPTIKLEDISSDTPRKIFIDRRAIASIEELPRFKCKISLKNEKEYTVNLSATAVNGLKKLGTRYWDSGDGCREWEKLFGLNRNKIGPNGENSVDMRGLLG